MSINISDKIDWGAPSIDERSYSMKKDWTLPKGEYKVEIIGTKMRSAEDHSYSYIDLQLHVLSPKEQAERVVYVKLYTKNMNNPKMAAANKEVLKEISFSCFGKMMENASDFVGGKCFMTLDRQPERDKEENNPSAGTWPAKNKIIRAKALNGTSSSVGEIPGMSIKVPSIEEIIDDQLPF